MAQSSWNYKSEITEYSLQAWRLSHPDEFYGEYWVSDEGVWNRGGTGNWALRGDFLVQAALFNKLMLAVLPSGLCQENVQMEHSEGEDIDFEACNEDPMSEVALAEDKLDFDDMQKIQNLCEGIQDESI